MEISTKLNLVRFYFRNLAEFFIEMLQSQSYGNSRYTDTQKTHSHLYKILMEDQLADVQTYSNLFEYNIQISYYIF